MTLAFAITAVRVIFTLKEKKKVKNCPTVSQILCYSLYQQGEAAHAILRAHAPVHTACILHQILKHL